MCAISSAERIGGQGLYHHLDQRAALFVGIGSYTSLVFGSRDQRIQFAFDLIQWGQFQNPCLLQRAPCRRSDAFLTKGV